MLTPILLGLLVLLVFLCLASLPASHDAPTGEYVHNPLAAGLLEGYMTMDSIAALAFGIIVVTSLGHTGGGIGAKVVRRTSTAALIAGALLGVVYVGLGPDRTRHPPTRRVTRTERAPGRCGTLDDGLAGSHRLRSHRAHRLHDDRGGTHRRHVGVL